MAGKIPRAFIDDLIARTDLVDLIDARVPLKKAGINYQARCPFHSEKTPSFNVSREKQFYHCFGCGASGNAIGFLMNYERLTFVEAVETLADSLGLEIPRETEESGARPATPNVQPLYDIQEQVAAHYARQLREHPQAARARDYLKARGVSGEIAKRFQLGYAPPGWRNLPDSLSSERLLEAGLLIAKEPGQYYDRFRDRVMFPIRDRRGRVVGFGGRVLGEDTPKYLNSPETPVFKKHLEVYGLHELLETRRKIERIVVVEGYMDVIALAQHDIPYAVATLGTATSADHAVLLLRYARELAFCFDGDNAGRNAAWKALEASLPVLREGRSLRFLPLPEAHDPDSLVREEGKERFERRLAGALPLSDYFFQRLGENLDLRAIEGRANLYAQAKPLIEKLPEGVYRDMMRHRLKELTGRDRTERPPRTASAAARLRPERAPQPTLLRRILTMLVRNPGLFELIDAETRASLEREEKAGALVKKLFALFDESPGIRCGGVLERFREEPEQARIEMLSAGLGEQLITEEEEGRELPGALKQYLTQCRKRRLGELEKGRLETQEEKEEYRRLLSLLNAK
jgi:DNA primase